ncbi:MAG: YbaB/EbfC family nucleoid-associated protein [Terrimicrobiaceae bacterium]|nr:YbaB/EbfC family nucleoid-associated protein [Terrimicrobiaceae bacterium]
MNIQKMLKQAQRMQEELARAQEQLAARTFEASAGGGLVRVTANGSGDVVSIRIDPKAVDPSDVEALEDLILAGVKQAQADAKAAMAEDMKKITGGMNLPGMGF